MAEGVTTMGRPKKAESRKHAAAVRIEGEALEQARLAAGLLKISLAQYVTQVVAKAASEDVEREVRKLAKNLPPRP